MPRLVRERITSTNDSDEVISKKVRSQRRNIVNQIASDCYTDKIIGAASVYEVIEKCHLDNVGTCPWLKKETLRNAMRRAPNNYKKKSRTRQR